MHVALAAMVLRALLPTGWMPSTALAGGSPLMLCDGMAPSLPAGRDMAAMPDMPGMDAMAPMPGMDHDTQAPDHPQSHEHGTPCVFAAAAPLAASVVALPVPAPAPLDVAAAVTPARESGLSRAAYRPNAARAPPVSA